MKISLFYLPSIGSRADIKKGMAGLRGDLYDRMLAEVSEQARLADDLGYDSISFTEHHFHIEGFELSNNPVLLDLFVGMQTKNIRVGQLGIVLPSRNPIRVAEDIAMLDRMTGGRANAGFARGYQRRWVDVMAQQTHGISGALPHRHDEIDATNRAAFEECFRIVKKAWTEPMLDYDGRFWKVPVGGPEGGTPWTLEATEQWGSGVENGVLRQVGVVPKPVQEPHPPIFQPFASSEESIRWCAREGVTAILPPLHPKRERALFELFAEESGRPLGEGIGVLRGRRDRRHGRGSGTPVEGQRRVLRVGVVRAVRLQPRHGRPGHRRAVRRHDGLRHGPGRHRRHGDPATRDAVLTPASDLALLLGVQRPAAARAADVDDRTVQGRRAASGGL